MKKIFTLLAVAAMAIAANAQALTWKVTADLKASDGLVVAADSNCPLKFSNDGNWPAPKANEFGAAYPELTYSIQGSDNPKSNGAGYKGDNFDIPNTGCAYIFEPKANGTLTAYVQLGPGKTTYIVTGSESIKFTAENISGNKPEFVDPKGNGACGLNSEGMNIITATLKSGTTYALLANGSKVTFFGYNFVAEGGAGLDAIAADENAPVEYFNLQGIRVNNPENGLYIRRQGNKVTKVIL